MALEWIINGEDTLVHIVQGSVLSGQIMRYHELATLFLIYLTIPVGLVGQLWGR